MILQYFVTETATERKIPIEIDRATDADLAGTKSCWQTDWTSEFIGDPDLEKYAAKTEDGEIVALIKPQFEAGREKVGKKGVVREKSTHLEVIETVIQYALSIGFDVLNLEFSPIRGPEGNIEYLVHLKKTKGDACIASKVDIRATAVSYTHLTLPTKLEV